jgi:hypothetical protein
MPPKRGGKKGNGRLAYKRAKKGPATDNHMSFFNIDTSNNNNISNNQPPTPETYEYIATDTGSDTDTDTTTTKDDEEEKNNNEEMLLSAMYLGEPLLDERKARRLAIAYLFVNKYNSPEQRDWDEIPFKIKVDLDIPQGTSINNILNDILYCKRTGTTYQGESYTDHAEIRLDRRLIKLQSTEAQLIADCTEDGLSLRVTSFIVNASQKQACLPDITTSTIYNCIKTMKPIVERVKKSKQGDAADVTSAQAMARFRWVKQLMIMYQLLDSQVDPHSNPPTDDVPDYFNKEKLPVLDQFQTAYWDETHKKCDAGGTSSKLTYHVKFPRDNNGKLDLSGAGTYWKVKYESEVRLALGVAKVKLQNGEVEGRRAKPFVYSGKLLLSLKDFYIRRNLEIKRVRSLTGSNNGFGLMQ